MTTKFYYVMDPMCSWCYAFSPVVTQLTARLADEDGFQYIMGGLAPDSTAPMPEQMRAYLQQTWRMIAKRTGQEFNFDFWEKCTPRRSTYPACRAVIAAGLQEQAHIPAMVQAIQTAYYQQARNPSEEATLVDLAEKIGLDRTRFVDDLNASPVKQRLAEDFRLRDKFGVQGFPALIAQQEDNYYQISAGYSDPDVVQGRLQQLGMS